MAMLLAAPALATPPVSDRDAAALAAITPPAAGIDPPVVPDRGLVMAGAVNRLLPVQASAGTVAPSAEPATEGRMQDLLRRAGYPVAPDRIRQLPSICCGGCSG